MNKTVTSPMLRCNISSLEDPFTEICDDDSSTLHDNNNTISNVSKIQSNA